MSQIKPTMMRFEPGAGWSEATDAAAASVVSLNDFIQQSPDAPPETDGMSAEALVSLGESIQDVFASLKLNDPRLQVWTQVHAAIRLIGGKLQEKAALEQRLADLDAEVEGVRALASSLVRDAYQQEREVHATSKLRLQIAESLNEKLVKALKG